MMTALLLVGLVVAALLLGAGLLHLTAHLAPGALERVRRAPLLDLVVAAFTVGPWVAAPLLAVNAPALSDRLTPLAWGWGLVCGVVGQVAGVLLWGVMHEAAHRDAARGPRIVKALNRSVGRWRNHAAVWWTAWAVPVFWLVRVAEWIVYPPLVWLVRFPRYRQGEWVNVSRDKVKGLVGHDLIWCLYCDWMTGVWSLGTEMLRNVESFWCPIRFVDGRKCENCAIDFPDVHGGWSRPEEGIEGAATVVERAYPPGATTNAWFGHASRAEVTVEGRPPRA